MPKRTSWERVGEVWVDSGSVMVGDPCYTQGADATDASKDWNEFLAKTWPATWGNGKGQDINDKVSNALSKEGVGIVVSSGFGDGVYPVYVKYSNEGVWGTRVAEIKVVFIDEKGNHPYEDG